MPIEYYNDGIPDSRYKAVLLHDQKYSKGEADFSATELLQPPQIRTLLKNNHVQWPASTQLWSLWGSAMHHYLEIFDEPGIVKEQRLFTTFEGVTISGQIDRYDSVNKIIEDNKTCKAYAAIFGKESWEQQLNIYAWLADRSMLGPISELRIVADIRDWSDRGIQQNADYPKKPSVEITIPLWSYEERERFVLERIRIHQRAEQGDVLPCSSEDRWRRGDVWKVYKNNNKTSTKNFYCDSNPNAEQQAKQFANDRTDRGKDTYVARYVPGNDLRCEQYCAAASVCPQWKSIQTEK